MGIAARSVIPAAELRDMVVARSLRNAAAVALAVRAGEEPAAGEDLANVSEAQASDTIGRLKVNFSRFNNWYPIDDWWEGRFLERTVRGAFAKTIAERGPDGTGEIKTLFDHGWDWYIGDKVLAVPDRIAEEEDFAVLEGDLLDTSYNRDLAPGLRAGAYGSSFMFQVLQDSWNHEPEPSDYNPDGWPERTISEVRLFEAGPVTWPANPGATAELNSVRSDTARLYERMERRDPSSVADLRRRIMDLRSTPAGTGAGSTTPGQDGAAETPTAEPVRHSDVSAQRARRQRAIREAVITASR